MKNKYPIFIPTKGRASTPQTIKMFQSQGVDFTIVVEPQEYVEYAKLVSKDKIITTPHRNEGLTVTRNFIWDFAESKGYKRFWTFDDNIGRIYRWNRNTKMQMKDGIYLRVIEDFADRYENLHICGMNYMSFAKVSDKIPAYYPNTRVYSNMLIRTNVIMSDGSKLRNKLFYNDDTDLCLRLLKDGFPTVQFNAFLIDKMATMRLKGGMTDYYQSEECKGRLVFAQELRDAHPDVTKITQKFGRWHHHVNYKPFKGNKLIRNPRLQIPSGVDEYGIRFVKWDKK
jgi:hypothetical protein